MIPIDRPTLAQRLFVALQYPLPQHLLSGIVFRLTRLRMGLLTRLLIRVFVRVYRVDLAEAENSDPAAYGNFNQFFTRALRKGVRPREASGDAILAPVDGRVSQLGAIYHGCLLQAKGQQFRCAELLGGDAEIASRFDGGLFATLYLSPRDYHRIHMPLDGSLTSTIHIPGRLFSVNPTTAIAVPGLYARNERLVCLFETESGPMALVLVGAIFVGSIETLWSGRITPPRGRSVTRIVADGSHPALQRGAEIGRFNMGSTVILLLPRGQARWDTGLKPNCPVRCGSRMGAILA